MKRATGKKNKFSLKNLIYYYYYHYFLEEECDLFNGRWVKEPKGPSYTNESCRTLPELKNCGKYGKEDGYLYWRWKPDDCELPRFDPKIFLAIVRGKKLAFVGDSLARNHMESILCLLSQVNTHILIQHVSS